MDEQRDEMRDQIADWLRDAYAMERGLESALEKHARNDDLRPALRSRAAAHRKETRRHAEEVKAALKSLGTDTSGLKTSLGIMSQATKGMGSAFAQDERIKDLLDAYSMEHFEIGCYTSLGAAAERAGFVDIARMCQRILRDEERMADALIKAIPMEVSDYLFEAAAERL